MLFLFVRGANKKKKLPLILFFPFIFIVNIKLNSIFYVFFLVYIYRKQNFFHAPVGLIVFISSSVPFSTLLYWFIFIYLAQWSQCKEINLFYFIFLAGKRAVVGYEDGTVRVWDLKQGNAIHVIKGESCSSRTLLHPAFTFIVKKILL